MPDYWSVPLATGVIDDLDSTIAKGPDLSWIGNLPDSYWQGKNQAYVQNQRDLFKNGVPSNLGTLIQQYAQAKGADATPQLIELAKLKNAQNVNAQFNGGPNGASAPPSSATAIPNSTPRTAPVSNQPTAAPASPATLAAAQPNVSADVTGKPNSGVQNLSDATSYSVEAGPVENGVKAGALTARSLAYRSGGNMYDIANALGVSPDEVLDPNDPTVRQRIAQIVRPQTTGQPVQTAAAPVQTAQTVPQQQPQGVAPVPAAVAPQSDPSIGGLVPPTWVQRFGNQAPQAFMNFLATNVASGVLPADQVKSYQSRIDAIQKVLGGNAQLTPEEKNARSSGVGSPLDYQGKVELNKQDVDNFNKEYQSIQSLGRASYNGLQKAQLMKNLTLQPGFYSGPFNELSQSYNQFKSVFGSNPSSALPQEAFNKVVNDALQEQVRAMGQSGVGRVLQSEVNIMRNSIASLGITASSNRALAEILSRVYQQSQDIAQLSQNIPQQPGSMTKTLNQRVDDYLKQHPLFSAQEKQHPELLGAPDVPPQATKWSPAQVRQWAAGVGLKSGDPIRLNGNVVSVP